ncbi:HIRAN domain-containing protein [Butyrivibrio sp. VCD2006]|uniref:HIRAN domain-containing protein n=1 Tax=Butyrivibrio sp. VCD2006 TaxID=1280664 RepID=UPI000413A6F3|nr:HIRAN domain-containing protein [Butyrivibrio sp. VCD2006]
MKDIYFTITGMNYYYGSDFLKKGMKVKLVKEPDNEYDKEAIRVELKGLGKIGYVANSPHTVIGESKSAGRMYDLMKKKAKAKIVLITPRGALCELKEGK